MHTQCMCIFLIDNFDFSAAKVNVLKKYTELMNLPITSMLGELFENKIITFKEKQQIEAKSVEIDRIVYFLDRIIIPSINANDDMKIREFIKVMKESGDSTLISIAAKLGK